MNSSTEKIQPLRRDNKWTNRWILIIILFVILLLAATRITPVRSSDATLLESLPVTSSITPTTGASAVAIIPATATAKATATATATAIATATSLPTATQTPAPSKAPETTVQVSGTYVKLRTGPGARFEALRELTNGEPLLVLGRIDGNTWLYVKTSDGLEGWTHATMVNLTGINLDDHPIQTPSPSLETTVKVSADTINLRAGPSTDFSKVGQLTYGETLLLLGRLNNNTWLYVKTSAGLEGWVPTTWVNLAGINLNYDYFAVKTSPPTETSTPVVLPGIEGRWIDVDLSEQRLYAYEGTERVATFLVSTGLASTPTEQGQFHIDVKHLKTDMRGDGYFLPDVPFTMFYFGDYAIHGTYWHHNFGTRMSRGCINMDIKDAEWVFNWASVGTLVNIHR